MKIIDKRRGIVESVDLVNKAIDMLGIRKEKKDLSKETSQTPVGGQGSEMSQLSEKTKSSL